MKKIMTITAVFACAFFIPGVSAQDKPEMQHSMKGMDSMQGKMQMSKEKMDDHMRAMQTHMLMMHDYSNKILSEKDPEKKQKLKDEQLELMKAHHKQMMMHRQKMKQMHQKMMK